MELLNVFAMAGMVIDAIVAIISVIGSVILFIGSFSKAPLKLYGRIANWSILGLVLGIFFQLSTANTGTTPDQIGLVIRMIPIIVNALLALSLMLLLGRWWLRRNQYKFT